MDKALARDEKMQASSPPPEGCSSLSVQKENFGAQKSYDSSCRPNCSSRHLSTISSNLTMAKKVGFEGGDGGLS